MSPAPISLLPDDLDPAWLDAFVVGLANCSEIEIPLATVWGVFNAAFPHRQRVDEPRRWLWQALQHAVAQQAIRLPSIKGRLWENHLAITLPTIVYRIPAAAVPRDESWRRFAWDERLAWIPNLIALNEESYRFLQRVQKGLVHGEFERPASFKHRSLKLTDHEKRLGDFCRGALFKPGRLTLELLNCLPDIPPLAWEAVNAEPAILIFENSAAFQIAWQELRTLPHSPYGMVACGYGNAFVRSVQHLKELGRTLTKIHYVGDLDRPGLAIAQNASQTAVAVGLPAIEPAPGMHAAMIVAARKLNHPEGWEYQEDQPSNVAREEMLLSWLPPELRAATAAVLAAKRRIPEEVLGPEDIRPLWQG